jgi:hypothetical protein
MHLPNKWKYKTMGVGRLCEHKTCRPVMQLSSFLFHHYKPLCKSPTNKRSLHTCNNTNGALSATFYKDGKEQKVSKFLNVVSEPYSPFKTISEALRLLRLSLSPLLSALFQNLQSIVTQVKQAKSKCRKRHSMNFNNRYNSD